MPYKQTGGAAFVTAQRPQRRVVNDSRTRKRMLPRARSYVLQRGKLPLSCINSRLFRLRSMTLLFNDILMSSIECIQHKFLPFT